MITVLSLETLDFLAPVDRVEQQQELDHIEQCENQALEDLINEAKRWGDK